MKQYNDELLRKVQDTEKEILIEIIRICKANSITYYLDFGSLLGAVRNGGFIPWDDDIDISMMREDYEKFILIAPSQLSSKFSLQHFSTEPNTPTYWAKVVKNGTIFTEQYMQKIKINQGVFVDVFPMDKVPDSLGLQKKHTKKVKFLRNLYISKTVSQVCTEKRFWRKLFFSFIRKATHFLLLPIPKKTLFNLLDREIQKYNSDNSDTIAALATTHSTHRIKSIFPLRTMLFSGISVLVPNDTDVVLKKEYGDYMKLPPTKERVGHCPDIVKI